MTTSTTTWTTTITITNNNNTSLLTMVSLATPFSLIFVYMMWSVLGMLMVTGSWYIMYWQLGLRSDQCTHNVNLSKQILDCETESLLTLTLTLEWSDQTDLFNNKLLIFLLICDGLSWPVDAAGKMTERITLINLCQLSDESLARLLWRKPPHLPLWIISPGSKSRLWVLTW